MPTPDRATRLRAIADPAVLARWPRLGWVAETGSTNADLRAELQREPGSTGRVLVADFQSAGRGRLDRTWVAPPGSAVAVSVTLRPSGPVAQDPAVWSWLPLLTGSAVVAAVRSVTAVAAGLKWPNDVVVGDRKLAGILTELIADAEGPICVIGCGLNTAMAADRLSVPTATSLAVELGAAAVPDPVALVAALLGDLAARLTRWEDGELTGLRQEYLRECATLRRTVRVSVSDGPPISGEAVGVDLAGRLQVRTTSGVRSVAAGDVVHARPSRSGAAG